VQQTSNAAEKYFCSVQVRFCLAHPETVQPHTLATEQFLEMLRFPQQGNLNKLFATEDVSNIFQG
jgi:hypothetical protein